GGVAGGRGGWQGELTGRASRVAMETHKTRRFEKDFFMNVEDTSRRADYLKEWKTSFAGLNQAITNFAEAATEVGSVEDQQQAARWREQAAHYGEDFEQIARAVTDGPISTTQ